MAEDTLTEDISPDLPDLPAPESAEAGTDDVAMVSRLAEAGFDLAEVWQTMRRIVPPLPAAEAVTVAYVMGNEVTTSWHHSIMNLHYYDHANAGRVYAGGVVAMRYGTDGLPDARNQAVGIFLEEKPADWLFWIDTDMGFEPDIVDRLREAADPVTRPIVGALCFAQKEIASDGLGGWRTQAQPTVYTWAHEGDPNDPRHPQGFAVRWDYPDNALIPVRGTGSAALLIHRSVFERIRDAPVLDPETGDPVRPPYGPHWYDRAPNLSMRQLTGEDLSFCMRAWAHGIPIYVLTSVKTSHKKSIWLSEDQYWAERAQAARAKGSPGGWTTSSGGLPTT